MKLILYFLTYAVLVNCKADEGNLSNYNWGQLTNNIQMGISLKNGETSIRLDSSIILLIHFRNTSTNETFGAGYSYSDDRDLSFKITNSFGWDVSPKFPNKYGEISAGTFYAPLNKTNTYQFNFGELRRLGYLKSMNKAGEYKIVARLEMISLETKKSFTVTSNLIRLKIVE